MTQGVPGRLKPRILLIFQHYKGGRSSAKRTGHLYPWRNPWYSLSEAESTSGHMVLSGRATEKSPVTPPGIDPGTIRLVAQCLNHFAIPGPLSYEVVNLTGWSYCNGVGFYLIDRKKAVVTGLEWHRWFQYVKVPRFHDNSTGWWEGQSYAPATLTPRKYTWYSFLLEAESTSGP